MRGVDLAKHAPIFPWKSTPEYRQKDMRWWASQRLSSFGCGEDGGYIYPTYDIA